MNGLKYGETISKSVQGAEGIQLCPLQVRYDDFTPLASVLSTTVAQSDTVSPQEKSNLFSQNPRSGEQKAFTETSNPLAHCIYSYAGIYFVKWENSFYNPGERVANVNENEMSLLNL